MNEPLTSGAHERHAWGRKFFSQVQRYRDLLARRWWIPAICIALGLCIGAAMNKFLAQKFVSIGQMIVSIRLNNQQTSVYSEEQGNFLGTQAALMQGPEVLAHARDRLSAQNPNLAPQPVDVQVSVLPKTTIFVLRASGANPDYTKMYLQACMEEYINLKKGMAAHTSDTTIAGLTDQMLRLEPEMQKIDAQLGSFLGTNEVALLEEATSVGNYLTRLYQGLAEAQSQMDLLSSMTLDQNLLLQQDRGPLIASAGLQSDPSTAETSSAQGQAGYNPVTAGMQYLSVREQIQLLKAEQERCAEYLKPAHPKMAAMADMLVRLERILAIYRQQSVEQLEARKSALTLQITNLQNQIKQWGKENIELSRKSAEYGRIKARGERLQSLYDQLLATLETLDVNKDISPETVTVYQEASDAFPDTKLPTKRITMGGLLGFALSVAILLLLARVDDRMSTFVELEELFDEEVLGQIPLEKIKGKSEIAPLLQPDDPRHPFVESYRNLRSSLLYMAETGTRPHMLLITSSVPNDGKSTTAANLAIMLAMSGSRVLLVDADLRKGNLHNRFGVTANGGLSEALSQNADWRAAVKQTSTANLFLLPRGATTQSSSELFIGDVMKKFLQDSNREYDYVLLDTAPVMAADDVTSLAPRVDGVIFVVRAQHTSARVARASLDMLYQRKARVLGLVFNSVRASTGDYYYYHRYKDYYAVTPEK